MFMKNKLFILLIILVLFSGYFFLFRKTENNIDLENDYKISEVLEENERVWSGVLPCVDCEGILVSLVLSDFDLDHESGEFTYSELYLGEEGGPYIKSGVWTKTAGEVLFDPNSDEFENFSYTALGNGSFLVPVTLRITPDLAEDSYLLQEER